MSKIKFITTPLYYVNDKPHIGHAYTQVAADCLARYYRQLGWKVHFLTGTDEHGEKIARAAAEENIEVKDFVHRGSSGFKKLWKNLNIDYDAFIRTTDKVHKTTVKKVIIKLHQSGLIYKGVYEGWYCVPCESFFIPEKSSDNLCPDCGRTLEKLKQDSYFFKLSKFQKPLLRHIEEHPDFIMPSYRRNEITGFLKEPLHDLSISRKDVSWGIPFPYDYDEGHTVYVWFDALINYISASGFSTDDEKFKDLWPADVQIIGKDILKFHAVIWPAILMALDIELPEMVFAHGWWTVEGEKMSKSLKNVVDPEEIVSEWGVDALRYFLLREVTFGMDGNFSRRHFITRYNTDLANDLGNLLSRVLSMIHKYNPVPLGGSPDGFDEMTHSIVGDIGDLYDKLKFNVVLERIWELVKFSNIYIERNKPWELAEKNKERLGEVLANLFEALRVLSDLIYPFMPYTSREIKSQLGVAGNACGEILKWSPALSFGEMKKGNPLFPKK